MLVYAAVNRDGIMLATVRTSEGASMVAAERETGISPKDQESSGITVKSYQMVETGNGTKGKTYVKGNPAMSWRARKK